MARGKVRTRSLPIAVLPVVMEPAPGRALLAASLLSLVAMFDLAAAEPSPLNARVVWVHDQRVYLASPDSTAIEPGLVLSFVFRGKRIATGEVSQVYDRELACARLTSGSLESVKKLERLRLLAERPPVRPEPRLRVGCPSRGRSNLLFACDPVSVRPPLPDGAYRTDHSSEHSWRLIRESAISLRAPWPDTLLIRLFDDAADEEIALERGELEVALFWPGELSSRMREQPQWRDCPLGTRGRGVVATMGLGPEGSDGPPAFAIPESLSLAMLNQELFRGDLAPWVDASMGPETSHAFSGSRASGGARFVVDPSIPGHQALERFLNRGERARSAPEGAPQLRVFYLDAPIHALDSLALGVADYVRSSALPPALTSRADSLAAEIRRSAAAGQPPAPDRLRHSIADSMHVRFAFAVRCPVLCAPALRRYVGALGADAFADLLGCPPAGRQP